MSDDKNNMQAVLDAGARLAEQVVVNGQPMAIVPTGYRLEDLSHLLPTPMRIKGHPKFDEVGSFARYVKEFKEPGSRIFTKVTPSGASLLAVLDYHDAHEGELAARWCQHRASYDCGLTVEWLRWVGQDKKAMPQVEFAAFLESNAKQVVAPEGAELLEMVTNLEGKSHVRVDSMVRLSNGKQALNFEEDVTLSGSTGTTKGKLELPQVLELALQPFVGGATYRVGARLRYRIAERKVVFWYELVDTHLVIRDAVQGVLQQVQTETGIEPLMGSVQ